MLRKFHIKMLQVCPLHLLDVARNPKKSHFHQYYSVILLVIYVISEKNKV